MERWKSVVDELSELHKKHPDDVRRVLSTLPFEAETVVLVWNAIAETVGVLWREVEQHNINGLSFGTEFQRMYAADSSPMHCVRWLANGVGTTTTTSWSPPAVGTVVLLREALDDRFTDNPWATRKYRTLLHSKPAITSSETWGDHIRDTVGRWGIFGPATTDNRASFEDIRCLADLVFNDEPFDLLNFLRLGNIPPIAFHRHVERLRAIFDWIRQDLSHNQALVWLGTNYDATEDFLNHTGRDGELALVIRVLHAANVGMAQTSLGADAVQLDYEVNELRLELDVWYHRAHLVIRCWKKVRDLVCVRRIALYWFEAAEKKACCPLGPARRYHDALNRGDAAAVTAAGDALHHHYLHQLLKAKVGGEAVWDTIKSQAAALTKERIASLR